MTSLKEILTKIVEITKCDIAFVSASESFMLPKDCHLNFSFNEISRSYQETQTEKKLYKGFDISLLDMPAHEIAFLCIRYNNKPDSRLTEIVRVAVEAAMESRKDKTDKLAAFLDDPEAFSSDALGTDNIAASEALLGTLIVIEHIDGYEPEILEIAANLLAIKQYSHYKNRLVIITNESDIDTACNNLHQNVLSDLLIDCRIAIGGTTQNIREVKKLYDRCIQSFELKAKYHIAENILNYEKMTVYRVVANMTPSFKEETWQKVFTPDLRDIMESELEITIETFFKTNLNITETANKLYIHRNTLLYRLDKIQRCTGFDLKKFEDSWLFKLAWLINKENVGSSSGVI